MFQSNSLSLFVQCIEKVPDPRSSRGQSYFFSTILAITLLGLLANISTPTEIQRWAKNHFKQFRTFLRFKKNKKIPHGTTFSRALAKLSLADLQKAFAEFLNALLDSAPLVAAVDGKTAKQMKDDEGNPIHMLNVFAQTLKLHLASWSVKGDKTNEPGCLKKHLGELFEMYPSLKLLTGDAIFAQRPLLEAIQEYHRDYLVQVKANQEKVLEHVERVFVDAPKQKPSDCKSSKKKETSRYVVCG
jgi:hypothetical protein